MFLIVGTITIFRAYFFIGVHNYAALGICSAVSFVLIIYPFVTNFFISEELWTLPISEFFLSYKILLSTLIQILVGLFTEWVISIGYQNRYSTPVYAKLEALLTPLSTSKEKIEKLKEYFDSEVKSLIMRRTSYRNLKAIMRTGATASPGVQEKILQIDSNYGSVEIQSLTCQIKDKTHRRRFNLFNQGRDSLMFQVWLLSAGGAFLLKYLAGIVYSEEKKLIRANSV